MGTSFETIYDRALITIVDYHLDKVAQQDYNAFLIYLQGILVLSVPYFDQCMQSLNYDTNTRTFESELTEKEINILAEIMVYIWFSGKTQDVSQFEGKLTNREFKTHSAEQGLKAKMQYLNGLREKYRQDISDYLVSPTNFDKIFDFNN